MQNNKFKAKIFRRIMTCLMLVTGFLVPISDADELISFAKHGTETNVNTTRWYVFCEDESHGRRGYRSYCYEGQEATARRKEHDNLNPGHFSRTVPCN